MLGGQHSGQCSGQYPGQHGICRVQEPQKLIHPGLELLSSCAAPLCGVCAEASKRACTSCSSCSVSASRRACWRSWSSSALGPPSCAGRRSVSMVSRRSLTASFSAAPSLAPRCTTCELGMYMSGPCLTPVCSPPRSLASSLSNSLACGSKHTAHCACDPHHLSAHVFLTTTMQTRRQGAQGVPDQTARQRHS